MDPVQWLDPLALETDSLPLASAGLQPYLVLVTMAMRLTTTTTTTRSGGRSVVRG